MTELLRTNDPVLLSWLTSMLAESNIPAIVLDTHTSIVEGSIGAIPRRVMVADADAETACDVLRQAPGAAIAPPSENTERPPWPSVLLGPLLR